MDDETKALMKEMADTSARKAVKETLITLGVNPEEPIETQKDMATLREMRDLVQDKDFQADLLHLRKWRMTMDGIEKKGIMGAFSLLFVGSIAAVYAFRDKIF